MLIELIAFLILGYITGRIGDYFAGHWNFFHHWVYGIILLIIGIFYRNNFFLVYSASFGVGLIISDLDDLLHLRIYGPDKKKEKKFWGFN